MIDYVDEMGWTNSVDTLLDEQNRMNRFTLTHHNYNLQRNELS